MALSKDQRLRALLKRGTFPAELPPPFHTDDLARYRNTLLASWSAQPEKPKGRLEPFTIPRVGSHRRALSVVNPVVQSKLAQLIANEWITIRAHLRKSRIAIEPVEIIDGAARSVAIPNFNLIELKQHDILAQYDYILTSDTSRFYSTIYTHSIPWALHGKEWCKGHLSGKKKTLYDATLGARLDTAVRHCQENQSIGIPIGPDTSRILSEIIAASIDLEVTKRHRLQPSQAYRNVDDWFVGLDASDSGETMIASMGSALTTYGLEIHPGKTKVLRSFAAPTDLWPADLRCFAIDESVLNKKSDLLLFIEKAFSYSQRYPEENVLNFAVKVSSSFHISTDNWPIYESFLLRSVRFNPSTLPVATKILRHYGDRLYPIGVARIEKLISDLIRRSAPFGYHFEVAWALFLSRTMRIQLTPPAAKEVSKMESSVCALLALDCRAEGLIPKGLNTAKWRKSLVPDGLWSNLWLLAYEADLKGWLKPVAAFVEHDPFFSTLKAKSISFYDRKRTVASVKTRKWASKNEGADEFLQLLRTTPSPIHLSAFPSLFEDVSGYGDF